MPTTTTLDNAGHQRVTRTTGIDLACTIVDLDPGERVHVHHTPQGRVVITVAGTEIILSPAQAHRIARALPDHARVAADAPLVDWLTEGRAS